MEELYGEKLYQRSLVNSTTGFIELRADQTDTLKVPLDKLSVESNLVISEVYSVGPTKAGNYYHDKYVEIYNQSDEVQYLDGLLIARVYSYGPTGFSYVDDPGLCAFKKHMEISGKRNRVSNKPGSICSLC